MDIPFIHFASLTNPFSLKLIARKPLLRAKIAVINKTAILIFPLMINTNAEILTAAISSPKIQFLFINTLPLKKKTKQQSLRFCVIQIPLLFLDDSSKIYAPNMFGILAIVHRQPNILAVPP